MGIAAVVGLVLFFTLMTLAIYLILHCRRARAASREAPLVDMSPPSTSTDRRRVPLIADDDVPHAPPPSTYVDDPEARGLHEVGAAEAEEVALHHDEDDDDDTDSGHSMHSV
jgi:hypothetical protein